MTTTSVTALSGFTIDCSDAARLAQFYADLTGGEVTTVSTEYGYAQALVLGSTLNFQQVVGYAAPQWPGQQQPQQYHLDFQVSDLDAATAEATSLGATHAPEQPGGDSYRVLLDPDQHPFCFSPAS